MLDVLSKIVDQANSQNACVGASEIAQIEQFLTGNGIRYDAVKMISHKSSTIVSDTVGSLIRENQTTQQRLTQPLANNQPNYRMACCLRDIEHILRYVTYAIAAGNASVLEERCIGGLKEMYVSLGVPRENVVRGLEIMKEKTIAVLQDTATAQEIGLLSGDCSSIFAEVATYFDLVSASVL